MADIAETRRKFITARGAGENPLRRGNYALYWDAAGGYLLESLDAGVSWFKSKLPADRLAS